MAGKIAVAEVIVNRAYHPKWPDTICGVVKQYKQFSFYWDGRPEHIDFDKERGVIEEIQYVVEMAEKGMLPQITFGATCYHAVDVTPTWSDKYRKTVQIGNHIFYDCREELYERKTQ